MVEIERKRRRAVAYPDVASLALACTRAYAIRNLLATLARETETSEPELASRRGSPPRETLRSTRR